jgi:hypothetical protein
MYWPFSAGFLVKKGARRWPNAPSLVGEAISGRGYHRAVSARLVTSLFNDLRLYKAQNGHNKPCRH